MSFSSLFVSQVQGPDPVNSGSSYYTYYTYDALNHLITVSMPRPTGSQSRSFSYGSPPGAYLLSATNPETGTVTYSYSGGLLQSKTDAKGQQVTYEYDDKGRLSKVRHWVKNIYGTLIEDTCQLVQLVYDANGDAGGFNYLAGRLAERKYSTCQNPNGAGGVSTNFIEMFDYTQAGRVTKKRLRVARGAAQRDLDASWVYDNEGRPTSVTYPTDSYNHTAGTYTFGYNALGQLNSMPGIVDSVTYGPAGEVLNISGVYSETRTYNSRLQLTSLNGVTFTYFASNNGKIQSQTDPVSGETITYAYDQLNRLISASSNQGWGQGFAYDGFGNLTDKNALAGSVPQLHIRFNPATNRQNGLSYDANGNQTTDTAGANTLQYDVENRLTWAQLGYSSLGNGYGYDPDNRRVYKSVWSPNSGSWTLSSETIDFFGIGGEKMSSYTMTVSGSTLTLGVTGSNVYFGGRLVRKVDTWGGWTTVKADRLGSFGKFYPYGEERGATGNETEKFATYYRDGNTGLDYAVNRYYSAAAGRFMSADPYKASAGPTDPESWNKYGYTRGDPANRVDLTGLLDTGVGCGATGTQVLCDLDDGTGHAVPHNQDPTLFGGGGCQLDGVNTDCQIVRGLVLARAAGPSLAKYGFRGQAADLASAALMNPDCMALFGLDAGSVESFFSNVYVSYRAEPDAPNVDGRAFLPSMPNNPSPGSYSIVINTATTLYANGSASSLAEVILHEIMHLAVAMGLVTNPQWTQWDGGAPYNTLVDNNSLIVENCGVGTILPHFPLP